MAGLLFPPNPCHGTQSYDIPPPARLVIYKAQKMMEQGRFTEAAGILEQFQGKCKSLTPGRHDSKGCRHYLLDFIMGNCYLTAGNLPAAKAHYLATMATNPGFHPGWMNLAKCCLDMKAYAEAGDAFLKAYETSLKRDPEILYDCGACFLTAGDNQKALDVFLRLLKSHPADIKLEWKGGLAQAYLACDQPRKALPIAEELSEKTEGKKRKQWQELRLHLYISLNMKKKALDYVNRLIQEYPLEPRWWKGLAYFHLRENRYRPALVALTVKGLLNPLTVQEKRIVADLDMALSIPAQAIRFYEEIAKESFVPDLAYRIAQCYIQIYQPEKSLQWVKKGLQKGKDDERLMLLKANLLYELKRYQEAADAFEAVARKGKRPGPAWLMAGYAAWNAGDVEGSISAFRHAATYPKQKKAAQKALGQLDTES